LLFSLLKDWTSGTYKDISTSAIIIVIIAIIYFVYPVDFVPDWLVGLGLVDDAAVFGLVVNQINKELLSYKKWKAANEVILNNSEHYFTK